MEKVKLPREVAEALVRTKERHRTWNDHDLFHTVLHATTADKGYELTAFSDLDVIRKWAKTRELMLANALLNGYEVEETPEDKVLGLYKDAYERSLRFGNDTDGAWWRSRRDTIPMVLDMLGIKIEGVND